LATGGFVYVVYLIRGLRNLHYTLGRRAFTIDCLGKRRSIPYEAMVDIIYKPGEHLPGVGWEPFWPGFHISTTRMIDGIWHSWATMPPSRRVRIVTQGEVIAVSPHRPVMFIDELNHRRMLAQQVAIVRDDGAVDIAEIDGADEAIDERSRRYPDLGYAWRVLFRERLLGDQFASALLAAGVVIPLLMAGYLYSQYEGIPSSIALHYNAFGEIDAFGQPSDVWTLPIIAAIVLAVNTALATFVELFDRFLSRLFLAATPAIQVLALIAMLRLMNAG